MKVSPECLMAWVGDRWKIDEETNYEFPAWYGCPRAALFFTLPHVTFKWVKMSLSACQSHYLVSEVSSIESNKTSLSTTVVVFTYRSKAVSLLSSITTVPLCLVLIVPHFFFLLCLGKAVLHYCGLPWVTSFPKYFCHCI